jgi:hypothetical protein
MSLATMWLLTKTLWRNWNPGHKFVTVCCMHPVIEILFTKSFAVKRYNADGYVSVINFSIIVSCSPTFCAEISVEFGFSFRVAKTTDQTYLGFLALSVVCIHPQDLRSPLWLLMHRNSVERFWFVLLFSATQHIWNLLNFSYCTRKTGCYSMKFLF